jgi:hypothetical protein
VATDKAPTAETKASESEETTSGTDKKSDAEYVEYFGPASRREITVGQWSEIGVKMPTDSNWTFGNGYKLPKKDFPPEAIKYLLDETRATGSKSFRIVTE